MGLKKQRQDLERYYKKRNFIKMKLTLLKIHNSQESSEDINSIKSRAKDMILEEVKSTLLSQQPIDLIFIELSYLLGASFHLEIKEMIIDKTLLKFNIILQNSIPIITHMKDIIFSINKLEEIFDNSLVYTSRYNSEWNIPGRFVFHACCYLKQKISDFIFLKGIDQNYLPDSLKRIILFEKKILTTYFVDNCCITNGKIIKFNRSDVSINNIKILDDEPNTHCTHRKMLSRIFLPFIDMFIEYLLDTNVSIDHKSTEMNVLSSFIILFQKIGLALTHVNYFESEESKKIFLETCDMKITFLLNKLKSYTTRKFTETVIAINTLIFVNNTLDGLKKIINIKRKRELNCIKLTKEMNITYNSELRKKIDCIVSDKFCKTFSEMFLKTLRQINFEDLDDEVKKQIIDVYFTSIFLKISRSIIRIDDAKIMTHQLDISVMYISKWVEDIPLENTIRNYLCIFTIHPRDSRIFVENFIKASERRFSFLHVLKSLENKIWNEELYLTYKEVINEMNNRPAIESKVSERNYS